MAIDVVLEAISEEMEYVTVNRWLCNEGDSVTKGQPLVELEADKANYELAAPEAGVLTKVLAVAGDEVMVGSVLAKIEPA